MSSLAQIRAGLQETIDQAGIELEVYRTVVDVVQPPALVVQPTESDFHVSFARGSDRWDLDLIVMVSLREIELAQDELDEYVSGVGPKSIRQVIAGNKSLGLTDTDASVSGMTEYGVKTAASIDHLAAVLRLVVVTSGRS